MYDFKLISWFVILLYLLKGYFFQFYLRQKPVVSLILIMSGRHRSGRPIKLDGLKKETSRTKLSETEFHKMDLPHG